jgi:hypothetical protein
MSKLLPILFFLASSVISGCKYSENFRKMETPNYVIEIPPYLSKAADIRPGASVQGRNSYRDVYLIVFEHEVSPDDSVFGAKLDSIANDIATNLRDPFTESDTSYTVNGLSVIQRRFTGIINDKRLVFTSALVRGSKADYEISGWMFEHKRGLWLDDLQQSISSFREK